MGVLEHQSGRPQKPGAGSCGLRAIPDMRWTVDVRGIGAMIINLRRNRAFWLRDPLTHEDFMLGALQQLIEPGDVVFDVGANIGLLCPLHALPFQCLAGWWHSSRCGKTFPFLQRNIQLGDCVGRTQVVVTALADYDGNDAFQIDDMSSASGTLDVVSQGSAAQGRRQYGLPPKTETVTVARLDTLVESGAVPVPQVIKIDVEGAEALVLRGAAGTLQTAQPTPDHRDAWRRCRARHRRFVVRRRVSSIWLP